MKIFGLWARLIGPRNLSDQGILWFHRRLAYQPLVAALIVAIALTIFDVGGDVDSSLMPTLAQVLPVLFLAQVVDLGFFAQRLVAEVGPASRHRELASRYLGISAQVALIGFLVSEGAALYGVSYGASTFTISLAILIGAFQALDLAFGPHLRGQFGPTALARMIDLQRTTPPES